MKKWSLLLAVAMVLCTISSAFAAVEVSGDAYIGMYDKYLWRGFDLSGSEGVVQGGVDLTYKNFTLSYWTNIQAFDDTKENPNYEAGEATETDITLDYSFDLGELVSMSVGNIFYQLEGLKDTNELYVGATVNTILEPSVKVYYDYDEAEEDGLFFTGSVGHSIDLAEGLSVSVGALVSYNQESDYAVGNYSAWHNYELSAGVDYAVNDNISISPSFMYSAPISDQAKDTIDYETLTGLSVTFSF